MEDFQKRAKTFVKEAAKKSQSLRTSSGTARISDLVSETTKKSKELVAEDSKKEDEIKTAALHQADQIHRGGNHNRNCHSGKTELVVGGDGRASMLGWSIIVERPPFRCARWMGKGGNITSVCSSEQINVYWVIFLFVSLLGQFN